MLTSCKGGGTFNSQLCTSATVTFLLYRSHDTGDSKHRDSGERTKDKESRRSDPGRQHGASSPLPDFAEELALLPDDLAVEDDHHGLDDDGSQGEEDVDAGNTRFIL